jgi:protein TonB
VPEKPAPVVSAAVPVPAPARAPARARAPESKASPAPASTAATLEGYKREAARHIYNGNAADIFAGAPPAVLKSVVVLSISVDAGGEVRGVRVYRSNGYRELEQRAMRSVSRATPLPRPDRAVMRAAAAGYLETWLFRDDGKFQIRSVAMEQEKGPE